MRTAALALFLAVAFAACSKDSPTQAKIIPPADTLGMWQPDTVYLAAPPTRFAPGCAGAWGDRHEWDSYPRQPFDRFQFSSDSAAYLVVRYPAGDPWAYYKRCDSSDVRTLEDGRVWLSASPYYSGSQQIGSFTFCGTVNGDTLSGSAAFIVYSGGTPWKAIRQPWRFWRVK